MKKNESQDTASNKEPPKQYNCIPNMFYKNTIREFGVLTIFSVMFLTGLLYKGYADAKQDEKYVNVRWKEIIGRYICSIVLHYKYSSEMQNVLVNFKFLYMHPEKFNNRTTPLFFIIAQIT